MISKRALSYAEAVLFLKPNCYWQMGEASGDLADSVGGVTLADAGTPTYAAAGAIHDDANKAVTFDGSDDVFDASDNNALDVGDTLSIVAWVKKAANDADHAIMAKAAAYQLRFNSTNNFELLHEFTASIVASTTTVTDTAYHFVCATKTGSTVKLYIDGVDVTGTVTNATLPDNTGAFKLGGRVSSGGELFAGTMDEVALFDYALTADQVRWLYGIGLQGDLKRRAA